MSPYSRFLKDYETMYWNVYTTKVVDQEIVLFRIGIVEAEDFSDAVKIAAEEYPHHVNKNKAFIVKENVSDPYKESFEV